MISPETRKKIWACPPAVFCFGGIPFLRNRVSGFPLQVLSRLRRLHRLPGFPLQSLTRGLRCYAILLVLLFAQILAVSHIAKAQVTGITDNELRQRVGLSWRPDKHWQITPKYLLYTDGNYSNLRRSVAALQVEYKVNKYLELGTEYRFATSYTTQFHRFRGYVKLDYSLKTWGVKWRSMYQEDVEHFDAEYNAANPISKTWRNAFALKYSLNRKNSVYAFTEIYTRLETDPVYNRRYNYGLGYAYLYKRRNNFSLEVMMIDRYKKSGYQLRSTRASLSYTYILGKVKKKKKKHRKSKHSQDNGAELPEF